MPISTDAIYAIIEKEGIAVEWAPFTKGILACYTRRPHWKCPVISIASCVMGNERLERSLLLEELGHHRTTLGTHVNIYTYSQRVWYTKAEYAALREAVRIGCPDTEFLQLVHLGADVDEIADHFWLTSELVKFQWDRLLATRRWAIGEAS